MISFDEAQKKTLFDPITDDGKYKSLFMKLNFLVLKQYIIWITHRFRT
jgi:hypothetical protein